MTTSNNKNGQRATATLPFRGRALLLVNGNEIKLRRKGLALLYYLAIEGPAHREKLAHLLWGRGNALQNLRVELHRLKQTLEGVGLEPFANHEDPLELTQIGIDSTGPAGEVLEGLDDVSPAFQEWLELQRLRDPGAAPASLRVSLVDELARDVKLPFVLVIAGEPGSGRCDVARDLATRLRLPLVHGPARPDHPSVNVIALDDTVNAELAFTIGSSPNHLWVLERSSFGEDPQMLLELRARIAPDRMRFVSLEPLRWWEVKGSLPQGLPFSEGARLFQAALGNPRYLSELVELREKARPGEPLPIPLTMRAAFALEARKLSTGARRAIEAGSVHAGSFTAELLTALSIDHHLAELEASGWMKFDGVAWRFTNELSRRMLVDLLPEGTKHHLRTVVARQLSREAAEPALAQRLGVKMTDEVSLAAGRRGRYREPIMRRVIVSSEVWLDEPAVTADSVHISGEKVLVSRMRLYAAPESSASQAHWNLDDEPLLLRLRGKAYFDDTQLPANPVPTPGLTIRVIGPKSLRLYLCQPGRPVLKTTESVGLPLTESFDYWIIAPAGRQLQIASCAPGVVMEFRLTAYKYLNPEEAPASAEWFVDAYSLEDSAVAGVSRDGPVVSQQSALTVSSLHDAH